MTEDVAVVLIELTDENRPAVLEMALAQYLGEECSYCHKVFETMDDLQSAVWAPIGKRTIAHKSCFTLHNGSKPDA